MKKLAFICIFCAVGLLTGCRKATKPEEEPVAEPKRDIIEYKMTVVPRAENKAGDTLYVRINGALVITAKGSVAETYPMSGFYYIKSGDVLSIYYNPGKATFNGSPITDENGLAVYLDYNRDNNILFKEFNCRCIANWSDTIP